MHKIHFTLAFAACLAGCPSLCAEELSLELQPAQTGIHWTLSTLLHTVHGTFRLKQGSIRLDRVTGQASGEIVIDALSGESGNSSRDSRMHSSILESKLFPRIVFRPDHITGQIPTQGTGKVDVHGTFELHGQSHEFTLPVVVQMEAMQVELKSQFQVPYIRWGLKNPSTFILRVDDQVTIELTASGRIQQH